jgi:hypothetical protein
VYQDYDSSYEELLDKHKACSLHIGRLRNIATETFKIIHGQCPVHLNDFIHKRESAYSFRYKHILTTPNTRTVTYGTHSFRTLAAKVWNSLPENARETVCFKDLKCLSKLGMVSHANVQCANEFSVCF